MTRWLLGGVALVGLAIGAWLVLRPAPLSSSAPANTTAVDFVRYFVSADGRIADTANGGISHSEGQGYGLLFAEAAADRAAFERIWEWTETHLARAEDNLFSWRWDPEAQAVTDTNNASDGEILIAWALLRAHDRWGEPSYRSRAFEILSEVEGRLVRPTAYGPVMLPGEYGFADESGVTANLSYWVFPAMDRFVAEGREVWAEVRDSGEILLEQGRFGAHGLMPDWLRITPDQPLSPSAGWNPEFGYNAVRIPLHLCWANDNSRTDTSRRRALAETYDEFWSKIAPRSADRWDVVRDINAGGGAPGGYAEIARLTAACASLEQIASLTPPSISESDAYFDAALKGLVALAIQDARTARQK